jgi:hypothetical protein
METETYLFCSGPGEHHVDLVEVLKVFHFVFGAWWVEEVYYFSTEAHVAISVMDVLFEIFLTNFVVHELMVLF